MAVTTMKAGEFKAKCLEVMARVEESGDTVVVTKRGKPVAQLGPVVERPDSLFGFLQGEVISKGDIVAPVEVDWDADRE